MGLNMVEMASSFNITVIGEGIETAEEIGVMKHLNINLLQGYYCARPMSLDTLADFKLMNFEGASAK